MAYLRPPTSQITLNIPGTLEIGTTAGRWYNKTGASVFIKSITASVGTAPTGQSILTDVFIGNNTAFAGGVNRPSIPIDEFVSPTVVPSSQIIPVNGFLTVSVIQIGSAIPGADLLLTVVI